MLKQILKSHWIESQNNRLTIGIDAHVIKSKTVKKYKNISNTPKSKSISLRTTTKRMVVCLPQKQKRHLLRWFRRWWKWYYTQLCWRKRHKKKRTEDGGRTIVSSKRAWKGAEKERKRTRRRTYSITRPSDYHSGNKHYYNLRYTCTLCGDSYTTTAVVPCSGPPCQLIYSTGAEEAE